MGVIISAAHLADNPPSGTFYDPENDGTSPGRLGVREHWNNPIDRQYSRNLGTGEGIETLISKTSPSWPRTGGGEELLLCVSVLMRRGGPDRKLHERDPCGGEGEEKRDAAGVQMLLWDESVKMPQANWPMAMTPFAGTGTRFGRNLKEM